MVFELPSASRRISPPGEVFLMDGCHLATGSRCGVTSSSAPHGPGSDELLDLPSVKPSLSRSSHLPGRCRINRWVLTTSGRSAVTPLTGRRRRVEAEQTSCHRPPDSTALSSSPPPRRITVEESGRSSHRGPSRSSPVG